MFTIEVAKKDKDKEFNFGDLAIFHKECHGGRITKENQTIAHEPPEWEIECARCFAMRVIHEAVLTGIAATAIDGEERKFPQDDIAVVQRETQ